MADAAREGFHKTLLQTVNIDVVVLAVAATAKLDLHELWVVLGHLNISGIYLST